MQTSVPRNSKIVIGCQNFDQMMEKKAFVIDKTMFIKEFMDDETKAISILRPRRFGKSLNLSMMKSFLSLGQQPSRFDEYELGKNHPEFVQKHCGQYPVIILDFKDCKRENWLDMYEEIWDSFCKAYRPHEHCLMNMFHCPVDFSLNLAPSSAVDKALEWMISSLYQVYKKRVIVLIDEYDTPVYHAFRKGFKDEAVKFFHSLYSKILIDNSALEKVCLMGIIGADMFPGKFNLKIVTVADEQFSTCFGFTENEVSSVFHDDETTIGTVNYWYKGYRIGSNAVINPWSFINFLQYRNLEPYWILTADPSALSSLLTPQTKKDINEIILLLLNDNENGHIIPALSKKIEYSNVNNDPNAMLPFLIQTGYLTYRHNPDKLTGKVWIPSHEVAMEWQKLLKIG